MVYSNSMKTTESQKIKTSAHSRRPVFIGGLMKSGTTLLRSLLGQHPRLFASFETHWFEDAVRFGWADPTSRRMELLLSLLDLSGDEYRMLCERKRNAPKREFIDIVLQYCCERAGKKRWVEKTPDNIRYWSLIQELWAQATLIHVTREYKDVYASWKVRRGDSIDTFLTAAKTAYDDIRPLLGHETETYIEIDYLELVGKTEQTMRRILEHIGEEWHPACAVLDVDLTKGERRKFKDLMGRDSWTLVSLSQPIFTSSIEQWREYLTEQEIQRIETELADLYALFGAKWMELPAADSTQARRNGHRTGQTGETRDS